MNPREAVPVSSVEQEYEIVAATPCACGAPWRVARQILLSREGHFYDQLEVVCARCGQTGAFLFDISAFFGAGLIRGTHHEA